MATSEFWRNLANEFRSVRIDKAFCWAEWNSEGEGKPTGWILSDHYPFRIEFTALALRAGHALKPDVPNSVCAWLDSLREFKSPFLKTNDKSYDTGVRSADGKEIRWVAGEVYDLCEASADFCKALEIGAFQIEAKAAIKEREREDPANVFPIDDMALAPVTQPQPVQTIGHEIERLRTESRITVERLSELVYLDPSTVSRHQTGDLKPSLRNLGRYDRVFSKLLGRKIVIGKTQ